MVVTLDAMASLMAEAWPSPFIGVNIISNQKQPSCKKRSAALEKAMVKKDVKSKVAAKKWL